MSRSFIDFNDNGFWARDGFVESFQLLLFEEIQLQYQDQLEWLNEYKANLALQSLPLIYGGMSMCFDETLTDNNRIVVILKLLDNIRNKIAHDSNYLTWIHLNSLRKTIRHYLVDIKEFEWDDKEIEKQLKYGGYEEGLPVKKYRRGFDLLRALVSGKLNTKVDSKITYWGD